MNRVALTFDDGPNGHYTLKILDLLKKHKVKACFFLLGRNIEYFPFIAKKIKSQGHLIGLHTYSHPHLKKLKPEQIKHQIEKCEEVFKAVLRLKPHYFRPPYGEYNKYTERLVRKKGYRTVLWDVDAKDWKTPSPKAIADRIVSTIKNGSIVLLHDGASIRIGESRINTVYALSRIIKRLKDKGYKFSRLDRLR